MAEDDRLERTKNTLVVDIGGTHVKVCVTGQKAKRKMGSGPTLTPERMVEGVRRMASGWKWDRVSIGYPGLVCHDRPLTEPVNLGEGWVGFDYEAGFGKPVRMMNDAAMQALGSYKGGRMLFIGLGTGLGSAMIVDGHIQPLELGHLPFKMGRTFEDYVGQRGLARLGKKKWRKAVREVVPRLQKAMTADYVVVGGGGVELMKGDPPPGVLRGNNADAFKGGFLMWERAGTAGARRRPASRRARTRAG